MTVELLPMIKFFVRYAYHMYDLLWGMEKFNYFAEFNGVSPAHMYKPTEADYAQVWI